MTTYQELTKKAEKLQSELMEVNNYSEVAYQLLNDLIWELEAPTEYKPSNVVQDLEKECQEIIYQKPVQTVAPKDFVQLIIKEKNNVNGSRDYIAVNHDKKTYCVGTSASSSLSFNRVRNTIKVGSAKELKRQKEFYENDYQKIEQTEMNKFI